MCVCKQKNFFLDAINRLTALIHLFSVNVFSAVFEEYRKLSGYEIEESIQKETSGTLQEVLLAVGKTYRHKRTHTNTHTHTHTHTPLWLLNMVNSENQVQNYIFLILLFIIVL